MTPGREYTWTNCKTNDKRCKAQNRNRFWNMEMLFNLSITGSLPALAVAFQDDARGKHTYKLEAQVTTIAPCATANRINHFFADAKFLGSHVSSGPSNSTMEYFSVAVSDEDAAEASDCISNWSPTSVVVDINCFSFKLSRTWCVSIEGYNRPLYTSRALKGAILV